ncbi:hypothetical protein ACWD0J_27155 [Streptomyces sp. NPDC003011]
MATLPSAERRDVPDMDSSDWFVHHDTVYKDVRVTSIDTSADYISETSTDNGQTWEFVRRRGPWDHVYGHIVAGDVLHALVTGYDVVSDGTVRIVRKEDGSLVRWMLRDDYWMLRG